MDINCTSNCLYQIDGKCTLDKVSLPLYENEGKSNTDCAYFSSRKRS